MRTEIIAKRINTAPFKRIIVQGEKSADKVDFYIDKMYGNLDLTSLVYTIRLVTDRETEYVDLLTKSTVGQQLILTWTISEGFTAVNGKAWVEIRGVLEDEVVVKFTGDPIAVRTSTPSLFPEPPSQVLEEWYDRILDLVSASLGSGVFIVVDELPDTGIPNRIYLVPEDGGQSFAEYVYEDDTWKEFGSITVDLEDYYTKDQVDAKLNRRQILTVPSSAWTGNTATIAVPGITTDMGPAAFEVGGTTVAQEPIEAAAGLGDTDITAGDGTITITATGVIPTVDLEIYVTVYGGA